MAKDIIYLALHAFHFACNVSQPTVVFHPGWLIGVASKAAFSGNVGQQRLGNKRFQRLAPRSCQRLCFA